MNDWLFSELRPEDAPQDVPHLVAFGGGVNSTALLCGWIERGLRPVDLILFSDTGGERPETYAHVAAMSAWLATQGYPAIVTVRKVDESGAVITLEQNCLDDQTLPSLAYGFKRCSQKFKLAPQEKYVNHFEPAREAWTMGRPVVKLVGFDADEPHRAQRTTRDAKYWYRYPLIEWGWGREECIAAIQRAGLDVPSKSACFFCPANTKGEIRQLQTEHPDLLARALALEAATDGTRQTVEGLGRRFSWRDLIHGKPLPLYTDTPIACDCYDGATDEPEAA
jgi:hypothetical protein